MLRKENSQLRAELARMRDYHQPAPSEATWETEMQRGIVYADDRSRTSSLSPGKLLAQLSGISKERDGRPTESVTAATSTICRSAPRIKRSSRPTLSVGVIAWLRTPCRLNRLGPRWTDW